MFTNVQLGTASYNVLSIIAQFRFSDIHIPGPVSVEYSGVADMQFRNVN